MVTGHQQAVAARCMWLRLELWPTLTSPHQPPAHTCRVDSLSEKDSTICSHFSVSLFYLSSSKATTQSNSSLHLSAWKKGKHSHKHARLGQSWFHNHSVTSLLSFFFFLFPFLSLSLLFSLLCALLYSLSFPPAPSPSHLSIFLQTNLSLIWLRSLFQSCPSPAPFYVLYLHTLSPTL